jgi:hypothetical protein
MGLAARADDLITHYPDLADRREAYSVVRARRRQLLDRQSYRRLDGEPEKSDGVPAATAIQRAVHEGWQPTPHHHRIVRKWISLRHHRPSVANRSGTIGLTATGNILGIGLSYRARIAPVSLSISSGMVLTEGFCVPT